MKGTDINFKDYFIIKSSFDLLKCAEDLDFETVLDVGFGRGGSSLYFDSLGKAVTSIDLDFNIPSDIKHIVDESKIKLVKSSFEDFESNEKFDLVVMSHVLEHLPNTGLALEKAKNLLSDKGWLIVVVPPYKSLISASHISTGWNLGQLMLNLLNSNFDIKCGHFVTYGYNVCAFVQKRKEPLPARFIDSRKGIVSLEHSDYLWPMPVKQHFEGNIESVNWFPGFMEELKVKEVETKKEEFRPDREFYLSLLKGDLGKKLIEVLDFARDENTYFYGAGLLTEVIADELDISSLKGILDRDNDKYYNNINNVLIYPLEVIKAQSADVIVITNYNRNREVEASLKKFVQKKRPGFGADFGGFR